MGKGKGNVGGWIFKINLILCEIVTDNVEITITALKIIQKS
jgi:ribosomal protein L16/L10AE